MPGAPAGHPEYADNGADGSVISALKSIRIASDEIVDYNVENIVLTPGDENDPELTAELTKLAARVMEEGETRKVPDSAGSSGSMPSAATSSPAEQLSSGKKEQDVSYIATVESDKINDFSGRRGFEMDQLKALALEAKRSGDMTTAKELMSQIMTLEGRTPAASRQRTGAKRIGAKRSSSPAEQLKTLMDRLGVQIKEAREAARVMLAANDRIAASSFLKQERSFEADLIQLRSMGLNNNIIIPVTEEVEAKLPIDKVNRDIPDGEMYITFSNLVADLNKCKLSLSTKPKFFLSAKIDLPFSSRESMGSLSRVADNTVTCKSSLFPLPLPLEESIGWSQRFAFTGILRNLKIQKYFEHHKFRFELYRQDSSFFSRTNTLLASGTIKLSPLLIDSRLEETVSLVDDARRPVGISIRVKALIRQGLSPKAPGMATKKTSWVMIRSGQPGRLASITVESPKVATASEISGPKALLVDKIYSFAVLEHELERLKRNPGYGVDPEIVAMELALEQQIEDFTMQVDLGQLNMQQYGERLCLALPKVKQYALGAKRAGRIEDAKQWLQHYHIMENELKEISTTE